MSRQTLPDPVRLSDDTANDKYPRMIVDRRGRLWVAWQRFVNKRDSIVVTCIRENCVVLQEEFSCANASYKPVLCEDAQGRIVVAWSEVTTKGADVFLCAYEKDRRTQPVQVSLGGKDLEAALVAGEHGGLWVAYHSFRSGSASIFLRRFDGNWSDEIEVTPGLEAYRPALVALPDGRVRVYFDAFEGGRYDVYSVECNGSAVTEPMRLSSGAGLWYSMPAVVSDQRGDAAVAWTGIGEDSYFCYEVATGGQSERVASYQSWYTSHDICADQDSLWFTWRPNKGIILTRRLDRASGQWSAPILVSKPGVWSRRPTTAIDASGTVWLAWQGAPVNGKFIVRNGDIYLQRVCPEDVATAADPSIECITVADEAGYEMVPSPKPPQFTDADGRHAYFGDIHGQISFSDGRGTHDQYYNFEKYMTHLNFGAVTDHGDFPDEVTASEFNVNRLMASVFNEPGTFVAFLAYEWTSNEVRQEEFGHKNVYYPGDEGEIFSPCHDDGGTPDALFANAKRYGALVVPHHVSASWGVVKASTDWSYHDPDVQIVTEITSSHGVMEYDGNPRAHVNPPVPNCSVQHALAKGYRLGLIGGSDTHKLAPGRNGGIAGVVCDELSREAIFNAIKARHCYASSEARLLIEFSVNGHPMGEEAPAATLGQPIVVAFNVEADRALVAIEIVRNNQTVHRLAPEGRNAGAEWQDVLSITPGTYYYLRIELEGGEFAWSSPVWLG